MKKRLSAFFLLSGSLFLLFAGGCHSAFVAATITNHSGAAISLIEVDYPSASFGVGSLSAEASFPYRFKVQGSGPIKMQFTDVSGKAHSATGPELAEGQQGSLSISIDAKNNVSWVQQFK
jgi:hypothetical protein